MSQPLAPCPTQPHPIRSNHRFPPPSQTPPQYAARCHLVCRTLALCEASRDEVTDGLTRFLSPACPYHCLIVRWVIRGAGQPDDRCIICGTWQVATQQPAAAQCRLLQQLLNWWPTALTDEFPNILCTHTAALTVRNHTLYHPVAIAPSPRAPLPCAAPTRPGSPQCIAPSYETLRLHAARLAAAGERACDLLICDEARGCLMGLWFAG